MSWDARPTSWGMPGHQNRSSEFEAVLDAISQSWRSWQVWVPTLTNITQGDGTILAKANKVGRNVDFRWVFTLGSTSAVGTQPRFTLPYAPASDWPNSPYGDVDLQDTGTANRRGTLRLISGSTVEIISYGTTGLQVTTTATVPHTWASTDIIACAGRYESAA